MTINTQNFYGASVWSNATQTIPGTDTLTLAQFDTVNYDPYNLWNNTTKRFVVGIPGYFSINANIYFYGIGESVVYMVVRKNGIYVAPGIRLSEMSNLASAGDVTLSGSCTDYAFNATDYYDLCLFSVNNDKLVGGSSTSGCRFQIQFLSP